MQPSVPEIRVLVVDDDEEQLRILSRLLGRRGYAVETVKSPFVVAELVRSFQPQIVLIDVNMPSLSGPRLLEVLRKYGRGRAQRLVLFSACDRDELARLADEVGADGWIEKTLDGNLLDAALRRLLE